MPRSFLLLAAVSLLGQVGCQKPDYTTVRFPDAPGGKLRAEAKVLSEGAFITIRSVQEPWSDAKPLVIGQCSQVEFYWAGANHAVVAYDKMEVSYFAGAPSWWGGADVTLCNRRAGACPVPASAATKLPHCDEHTM